MVNDVQQEIIELKAALRGAGSALRQLQLYANGQKPSPGGLKALEAYISEVDKVTNKGSIRGVMTP